MGVTIKDVAIKAGVSIATVSKYLNGFGGIKSHNRANIEKAIEELSYIRNNSARGLRRDKSYTIGIIWDLPGNKSESEFIERVQKNLNNKDYSVMICFHEGEIENIKRIFKFMEEKMVDGIVVKPIRGIERLIKDLSKKGIAIVETDAGYELKYADRVMSNVMLGIYRATEYLIGKGHRDIAILGLGKKNDFLYQDRKKGYLRAVKDYYISPVDEYMPIIDTDFNSGYNGIKKLMALDNKPSAIIFATYNICLGAMSYIHKENIIIPKDLSVIVYDDLEFALLSTPKLTAIRKPIDSVAKEISDIILLRINKQINTLPIQKKLTPILVERDSVLFKA